MVWTGTLTLADEQATRRLAEELAQRMRPGDVLALEGDLGSGKTALARAFIRHLCGADEDVPSPTFTLVQVYDYAGGTIWHFDLYRLEKAEDALELGIEDALATGICLIEWPDRLGRWLPAASLHLLIEAGADEQTRQLTVSGPEPWRDRLQGLVDDAGA